MILINSPGYSDNDSWLFWLIVLVTSIQGLRIFSSFFIIFYANILFYSYIIRIKYCLKCSFSAIFNYIDNTCAASVFKVTQWVRTYCMRCYFRYACRHVVQYTLLLKYFYREVFIENFYSKHLNYSVLLLLRKFMCLLTLLTDGYINLHQWLNNWVLEKLN